MKESSDKQEFYRFSKRLVLLAALMMAPMWLTLAFKWPRSNDMLSYSLYINVFSSQFWHGEWYPRWLADVNAGYGSPVFLFYPPLGFFVMSAFRFLGAIDAHGFGRLVLGMQLALVLAGFTGYYWLRAHFSKSEAQKGALLYAGFPYLFMIIYFGYALGQLFAVALFPLVLVALERLTLLAWRGVPALAFALSAMCLVHLPSLITFLPVVVVYGICIADKTQQVRQATLIAAGGICAMGLSAVYLLPMVMNQPYIHSELYHEGRLSYAASFYEPLLLLCFGPVILPLAILYRQHPKITGQPVMTKLVAIWVVILAFLLFMSLPLSKWLWDRILALQALQFARRFYLPMLPGAVFLALSWLPAARSRHIYVNVFAVMMAYTCYTGWVFQFAPDDQIMTHRPFLAIGNTREYQTRWMDDTYISTQAMPSGPEYAGIGEGKGYVRVIRWEPREIKLYTDITSDHARLWLHRFYFPGWVAGDVTVEPYHGLMALSLPKGEYDLTLTQPEFAGERMGEYLSGLTFFLLVLWVAIGFRVIVLQPLG